MGHLHVQIVGYLAPHRTVDEDVQVEVLTSVRDNELYLKAL